MNNLRILPGVILYFVWTISGCGSVSDPDAAVNQLEPETGFNSDHIRLVFDELKLFPNKSQMAVGLLDDSLSYFYGATRQNDTLRTIHNSAGVFEIGSISKVFTSALLAHLAVAQKVNLSDPIQQYLDMDLNGDYGITLKQLANHTSGLPRIPPGIFWSALFNSDNPYEHYDEERLLAYLKTKMEPDHRPGKQYGYSNLGVGILGYVLTRIEGKSYETLLLEYIVHPLKMEHTSSRREKLMSQLVPGLDKRGNRTSNWDLASLEGAGSILSSVEDLSRFGLIHFKHDSEVYSLLQERTFTVNDTLDVALGWHILKRNAGRVWLYHNGGTGGYRAVMVLDAQKRKGVIILTNISSGHKFSKRIDQLSFKLLESLNS